MLLVMATSFVAASTSPSPAFLAAVNANVFEVVVQRADEGSVRFASPLPLELLPYQERQSNLWSVGTAFALPHGVFVTAAHVLGLDRPTSQKDYYLRDAQGRTYPLGRITAFSSWRDFAAFEVPTLSAPGLQLQTKGALNIRVFTVGNALGSGVAVRDGLLTSRTWEEWKGSWSYLRFSAPASPGNSGGPLLDEQARVLGMVLAKSANENLNYALPVTELDLSTVARLDTQNLARVPLLSMVLPYESHATWPLPLAPAELRSRIVAQLTADQRAASQRIRDQTPWPETQWGYLRNRDQLSFLTQHPNGSWSVEAPPAPQSAQVTGGTVLEAPLLGDMAVTLVLPHQKDASSIVKRPRQLLDLLLEGVDFHRNVGGQPIRIVSLGDPSDSRTLKDRFGRIWFLFRWDEPRVNTSMQVLWLPSPSGGFGLMQTGSRGDVPSAEIDFESIIDYAYPSYSGSLEAWSAFLSDPELVPEAMGSVSLYWKSGTRFDLQTAAVDLAFGNQVLTVQPSATLLMEWGYYPSAEGPRWDAGAIAYYPEPDYKELASVFRIMAPQGDDANERTSWKFLWGRAGGLTGPPSVANNKTSISDVLLGPGAAGKEPKFLWIASLTLAGTRSTESTDRMHAILQSTELTPAEVERAWGRGSAPLASVTRRQGASLFQAIRWKDEDLFRSFLVDGSDLDAPGPGGQTALQQAVSAGSSSFVADLLEAGAKPIGDPSPVTLAIRNHDEALARTLLARVPGHDPVLVSQALAADLDALALDLLTPESLSWTDSSGQTLLLEAISRGQLNVARALIEKGTDLSVRDHQGWGALELALERGSSDLATQILHTQPLAPLATNQGWTALHCAALWCPEMIPQLVPLFRGRLDQPTNDGTTALMLALRAGSGYGPLLTAGASAAVRTKAGWTPLLVALRYGDGDVVDRLLASAPQTAEATTAEGWSAVSMAARYSPDKLEAVLASLSEPTKLRLISLPTSRGLTPLKLARAAQHREAAERLIQAGASDE